MNKNVSLEQLFKEIKKQTNYNVVWYEGKLNTARTINADFSNASLDQVMDKALSGLPLTYTIRQNNIVIKEKTPSLLDKVISHFKNTTLFGKVNDEKGNPLPGATIRIKDTKTAVLSNKDGNFSIESKETSGVLLISFLGYKPTEIGFSPINTGPFSITLKEDESILNEVQINAGYYMVSDRERTGSISKVTAETIGKQPVSNPLQALQGTIPGIQVTQQTGIPGGGFSVQIRGRNSINSGNDPLYVIDGVTYPSTRISSQSTGSLLGSNGASPLATISPNDIENIEILKDADATAIYGSRGANGVILITTKKSVAGNTKINIAISKGISHLGHYVDVLNTQEYLQMRKEAFKNDGLEPGPTDYDINGTWDQEKYTNWQKYLIGSNAPVTNASLNIGGGTIKSNYLINGSYYNEGTVFPGDFGLKRISLRSSINTGSDEDRFNSSFTANYSHTNSNLLSTDLTNFILLPPNAPDPYDKYGKINWADNTFNTNPMANLLQTSNAQTDNLIGNLILSYKILKNLIIKTSLGYTTIRREELLKYPLASNSPANIYSSAQRVSYFSNNHTNNWIAEPMITYKAKIIGGNLDALLGTSLQDNDYQLSTISAEDFASDDLMENINAASLLTANENASSKYRYSSVFARLNYNSSDKYFINLTARRDGSSRFGPGKQFANFGAIGGAWIFSEEESVKEALPFLSFGKLRASYGVTGNDQIGDYRYLQLWNINTYGTYQGSSTLSAAGAPNANFAWETNRKLETALQMSFFKDKLNVEISYYRNRSSNQLLLKPLPLSTGLAGIIANLPAIVQNKGWEFATNIKITNSTNVLWSIGMNLTIPKNKLVSYPGLENTADAINYQIGEPLSILKLYNVTVDKQTGLYVIEDKNGNKTIDNADRYLTKFIGQSYYGGISNSIKYKNFNLDFLFSFTKQTGRSYRNLNSYAPGFWFDGSPNNQLSEVLTRWKQSGDETLIQKFSTTIANTLQNVKVATQGNLTIVDASYIRLRNVSLAYSLPKEWLSTLKIHSASISLQGQNIFTLTDYIGLDPESSAFNLPPLRTVTMGLNVTF
ncbi:SusC/RagA family TonB-linked outer membrane protein [Pedobacter nutrimenti]|uniref:SusC/RagA family TonB-linked outer membrane protein n=1 Tax=Pedobacter nutrimenti TaxID=1241337 RepID=UPI002931922A|nr:SusC/RagA family TonB-linked outer membrane protein [Pedobacter nutrimenti]